jgi:hypothetical protein
MNNQNNTKEINYNQNLIYIKINDERNIFYYGINNNKISIMSYEASVNDIGEYIFDITTKYEKYLSLEKYNEGNIKKKEEKKKEQLEKLHKSRSENK